MQAVYLLLELHDVSESFNSDAPSHATYPIVECGPIEDTAEDNTSPKRLEDSLSTEGCEHLVQTQSGRGVTLTSVFSLEQWCLQGGIDFRIFDMSRKAFVVDVDWCI